MGGPWALNMPLKCCGILLSETGTFSQETPNPDFLLPCRGIGSGGGLHGKTQSGGGGAITLSPALPGRVCFACKCEFGPIRGKIHFTGVF